MIDRTTMTEREVTTIKDIKALKSKELLKMFEERIQMGAGINPVPFIRYRKEILFRMKGGGS